MLTGHYPGIVCMVAKSVGHKCKKGRGEGLSEEKDRRPPPGVARQPPGKEGGEKAR